MVLAGRERERGRNGDQLGAVEREDGELGEAQVVADGQPDSPAGVSTTTLSSPGSSASDSR